MCSFCSEPIILVSYVPHYELLTKGTFSLSGGDTSAVPAIVLEMETRAFCKSQHHMQLREAALPSAGKRGSLSCVYFT